MLKFKLYPRGKKHQRTFRIVVAEETSKFNGRYIDDIGFWTPQTKTIEINKEKFNEWTQKGAKPTQGVDKLLNPDKYPRKSKKTEAEVKAETVVETKTENAPAADSSAEAPAESTPAPEVAAETESSNS